MRRVYRYPSKPVELPLMKIGMLKWGCESIILHKMQIPDTVISCLIWPTTVFSSTFPFPFSLPLKEAKPNLGHWLHVYNESGAFGHEEIDLMDRPKVMSSGSSRVGRRAIMRPDFLPFVVLIHTDPSLTAPPKKPPLPQRNLPLLNTILEYL